MKANESGIVTFIVTHHVRKDRVNEFESVNRELNKIVASAGGYMGINVIRTVAESRTEYTVILRFKSFADLKRWADSPLRNEYVGKLRTLADHSSEKLETGLEYWFTTPESVPPTHPQRYKMAVVTVLVIYPLVLAVPYFVSRLLGILEINLAPFADALVSVILITILMTYWAMPMITRAFSFWLYDTPDEPLYTKS